MRDTCSKFKIIKLKKFRKVEFVDQYIVNSFVPQITEIVDLYDLEVEECFISDESMIEDFNDSIKPNNAKLNEFKNKYGFIPESSQYLYEIAQKMVCKRKR